MYGDVQLTLKAMMGTYPKTEALKSGSVAARAFTLDFAPIDTATQGFRQVCNDMAFDIAELAIMTYLQAVAAGKPLTLLPFVMNGNFHHKSLIVREDSRLTPDALEGRRVAMRSYTQTTPTWVRGILTDEYGIRMDKVDWMSRQPGHVAGYVEPAWVTQSDDPRPLDQMLKDGDVDAILASGMAGKPGLRTLIADPAAAQAAWYDRHGLVPINHMVVVHSELVRQRPEVIAEIYDMLLKSREMSGGAETTPEGVVLQPAGFDAVRPALEMAIRLAHEQELIPERFPVEALYGDVVQALG